MNNPIEALAQQAAVRTALAQIGEDLPAIVELAIAVQQIPAPTFAEAVRAAFVADRFAALGLQDVQQDALHNVFGRYPGRGGGAPIIVSAHSDTVFPAGTDLTVRRSGTLVHGPGIADNSLGVAGLLYLVGLLRQHGWQPARGIWFVVNTGEEGLGDLRGMRAVADRFGPAGAYIVVEGGLFGRICHQAIGVQRLRIGVETPGGHSWGAFGNPSAIHVLGQIIADIAGLKVPATPKTTFNVGVVEGGTSVNTIAHEAHLLLDLRSEAPPALGQLVAQVEKLLARYGREPQVQVTAEVIGNRPAGAIPRETPLVSWAVAALQQVGAASQLEFTTGSTDANIPLSRGWPAVCVGLTESGNAHRPDEYMDVTRIPAGLGQLLLLTLAAAG